jgi:hypothetical protein
MTTFVFRREIVRGWSLVRRYFNTWFQVLFHLRTFAELPIQDKVAPDKTNCLRGKTFVVTNLWVLAIGSQIAQKAILESVYWGIPHGKFWSLNLSLTLIEAITVGYILVLAWIFRFTSLRIFRLRARIPVPALLPRLREGIAYVFGGQLLLCLILEVPFSRLIEALLERLWKYVQTAGAVPYCQNGICAGPIYYEPGGGFTVSYVVPYLGVMLIGTYYLTVFLVTLFRVSFWRAFPLLSVGALVANWVLGFVQFGVSHLAVTQLVLQEQEQATVMVVRQVVKDAGDCKEAVTDLMSMTKCETDMLKADPPWVDADKKRQLLSILADGGRVGGYFLIVSGSGEKTNQKDTARGYVQAIPLSAQEPKLHPFLGCWLPNYAGDESILVSSLVPPMSSACDDEVVVLGNEGSRDVDVSGRAIHF